MKKLLTTTITLIEALSTYAGDNGFHSACKSASGRTELKIGRVCTGDLNCLDESAILKIDGQTIGQLANDETQGSYIVRIDADTVQYRESVATQTDLLTVRDLPPTKRDLKNRTHRKLITSGLDPRTNEPLKVQIEVTCRTAWNPI